MSVNLALNLAVVRGVCTSPAEVRVLPSGSTLVVLQVTTRTDDGRDDVGPGGRVGPAARPPNCSMWATRSSSSAGSGGGSSAPAPGARPGSRSKPNRSCRPRTVAASEA